MDKNNHTPSTAILLGQRIKELRRENKMSQETLAEKAYASVNTISSIERGIRSPSIDLLERISLALKTPLKDLFDFFPHQETIESPARKEILALVHTLREQPPHRVRTILNMTKMVLPKFK